MRYIIIILLSSLLIGCGVSIHSKVYPVPTELQSIVSTFSAHYSKPFTYVQYGFGTLGGDAIGECDTVNLVITLDNNFWASADYESKEEVVLHELGHCVLGRAHQNGYDANGYDLSLMNAYELPAWEYHAERETYLTELFTLNGQPMLAGFGSNSDTARTVCRLKRH